MRLALFSDVHANLHALRSVLAGIERVGVDATICAGDLVGYGAHPNECVEAVVGAGIATVAGNHDLIALGRLTDARCVQLAKDSQRWTRGVLSAATVEHLTALPMEVRSGPVLVTHGALGDPEQYTATEAHAARQLEVLADEHPDVSLLVLGHTHRQWAYSQQDGALTIGTARQLRGRCMVNPGSVGQSRQWERRPRARFAVVDLDAGTVRGHAVDYDVAGAREALEHIGIGPRAIHMRPGAHSVYARTRRLAKDTLRGARRRVARR